MFRKLAALAAICFGTLAVAHADSLLLPGGSQPPDLLYPNGSFVVQASGSISSFSFSDSYQDGVYKDNSNVICSGCLDFYFIFTNTGTTGVNSLYTSTDFAGFLVDAGYNGGSSVAGIPSSVDRSSDGTTVSFVFTDNIGPGDSTSILIIDTNAKDYTLGTFTIGDGTNTVDISGFAPAIPEPATLALFGTGLVGLVGAARRKLNV